MILSIDDQQKQQKLKKFAEQALTRAEELKGIKRNQSNAATGQTTTTSVPVQSPNSCKNVLKFESYVDS